MKKTPLQTGLLALVFSSACIACTSVRLVSDYDPVIDQGVTSFAVEINTHVKNMAELGGKPAGTYEATFATYNALDARLDVMISRADAASGGSSCQLQSQVYQKLSQILKSSLPPGMQAGTEANAMSASACNTRLLELVKQQLAVLRQIHQSTDKCQNLSCLRPATAKDALAIMNQSIAAVTVVETAKKQSKQ
jgi:hypothetical protein